MPRYGARRLPDDLVVRRRPRPPRRERRDETPQPAAVVLAGAAAAALVRLPRIGLAQEGETETPRPVELRRAEIPARLQAFRLRQSRRAEGRHAGAPDQADPRQPELRHLQHPQRLRAARATAPPA